MNFPSVSDSKEFAWHMGDTGSIPGQEDPLEKGMATYSSILAWRIPWTGAWWTMVHRVAELEDKQLALLQKLRKKSSSIIWMTKKVLIMTCFQFCYISTWSYENNFLNFLTKKICVEADIWCQIIHISPKPSWDFLWNASLSSILLPKISF